MKVELLENTQDDTFIANVARVSFDNWSTVPQDRDAGLIKYLATHKHISPFFHVRFTFLLRETELDFGGIKDPTLLRGAVWESVELQSKRVLIRFRTSYYGWVRLIRSGHLDAAACSRITRVLLNNLDLSLTNAAYELKNPGTSTMTQIAVDRIDLGFTANKPLPPQSAEMVDASFRITCSIPVARQLFTHRMFDTNEISRRYVSTTPLVHLFEELRSKPEGSIKQGSAGVHADSAMWLGVIEDSYVEVLALYDNLIAAGVAPEQARFVLPQAMETSIIFTGSIMSWAKLVLNRTDSHAQLEVQDVANDIHDVLSSHPEYADLYNTAITSLKL